MPDTIDELVHTLYERRCSTWQAALGTANQWLADRCREALGEGQDQSRLQVQGGRIKAPDRLADKLRRKVESGMAVPDSPEAAETMIGDIVGTKVLCKSSRDQRLLIEHLTSFVSTDVTRIGIKDYAATPKESGYRAVHLSYSIRVPDCHATTVEVQVKTRLQDAWSELTHEDLYKPGHAFNPGVFHKSVAGTMANLLAEVDRLADTLAEELERTVTATAQPAAAESAAAVHAETITVTVRTSGPRYALAVDDKGEQGLIRAADVRGWAHQSGLISVDDHVQIGDVLEVRDITDERGRYFVPLRKLA